MHGNKRFIYIFLFMFSCCSYFLLPQKVNATTIYDGHLELRMQTGSYNGINDGSAVDPEWLSGTFPNGNYIIIPGASDLNYNGYWFVKYFNLYFTSDTNFNVGQTYALEIDFNYGSYITWTDFYGWRLISDRNISYCAGGSSSSDLSQCSIIWNPTNDGSSSTMTLLYRPNTTSSGFGISIGSMQNQHFVMWNRYGDPQGFKVNQVRITSTQNSGTPSQDFSAVVSAIEDVKDSVDNNTQAVEDNTQAVEDMHDDIMSDDITDSEEQAQDFFNDFQHNSHGLSGIITAPLRLLNSLTSASCSPLTFQLPIVHNQVTLPCMKPIYENYFGVFFSLWQLITTGLISYTVLINLYSKIHNLQNPKNDRIEVLNL